ncbi:HAMP domain-containing sensor histidine kinase [Bacillus sp. JJ1562]|uniref:HAMP domain-containing sensor histidine kinase n=1 Tax=Bacillus sp. JJ1562 TaxID=3122960 RepID=UPI0030021BC7
MKEFMNKFSNKIYYIVVWLIIAIMVTGLLIDNPYFGEFRFGYLSHVILVFILSVCLLLYPRKSTGILRVSIILVASIYFYSIFLLYPETGSSFIFLCFIPALSILFFDKRLFYFSLILNCVSILILFGYITFINQEQFIYLEQDLIGSLINFFASQIIIYFIFYLTNGRMEKQKLYYEQIQQSERLKISGQLAAAVAHEIRNPLTVVKGFLQLFEQESSNSPDRKGYVTLMIDELNSAEQVISQFLSLAKPIKNRETEIVDVKVILKSVTDLLYSYGLLHENRIELKVTGECNISANNIELKQVLINIIKNAIEASNVGDLVLVTAGKEKKFVVIKVIDYGRGMSEEEVDSLGTPFYSLKSKGTGLGMMISFNIIEKYNGTIHFQTTEGHGTTVIIRFPSL